MSSPKLINFWSGPSKWLLAGLLLAAVKTSLAAEFGLESAGARFGVGAGNINRRFHQAEAFVDWNLPWGWDIASQWRLQTRLEASAGWLGDGEDAALGTLGPNLVLRRERFPLSLVGGVSPTILSNHKFETKDVGIDFQFTSQIGIDWDLGWHTRLGYRLQHVSNAGLGYPNPGLNMHVFAVSYVF